MLGLAQREEALANAANFLNLSFFKKVWVDAQMYGGKFRLNNPMFRTEDSKAKELQH